MLNTWLDMPPPYHQMIDMVCALESLGVDPSSYKTLTIMNSGEHSFHYWDSPDHIPAILGTQAIKTDVISFLDAHLK